MSLAVVLAVKLHRQSVTGGSRSSSPVRTTPKSGSPMGNSSVSGVTSAFTFQGIHGQSQHLLPPGLTPDMVRTSMTVEVVVSGFVLKTGGQE